jgi:diamine N-acetyltransferase
MLLPKKRETLAEGGKTVLRRFERSDVDRWLAWPRHADALFESYNPPSLTPRQRDYYYQSRQAAHDLMQFAVEDRQGELVGRISLREIDWRARCAVLGITFHPSRLGEGLGTDALAAFLRYYFGAMGMNSLYLDVAAFNKRAHRCYEKCGFRTLGHHWGEPQPDYAGVMSSVRYGDIRPLFRAEDGMVRPLLIDMALHRQEFFHWLRTYR